MKNFNAIFSALFLAAFTLCFTVTQAKAEPKCVHGHSLLKNAVLVQKEGVGVGGGVLYQNDIVITNHSLLNDMDKIWLYIPRTDKQVEATVLYSNPKPDLAVLKLKTPVEGAESLNLARRAMKRENMFLVSFPFSEKHRLGAVQARFNNMARFSSDTRLLYFNALIADWAFAGDSGGPFFNCKGELVGINLGNVQFKNTPDHVYGINMRAIEDALNAAGVEARIQY